MEGTMAVMLWVAAAAFVALAVVAIRFWAQARDAEHHLGLYRVAFEHTPDSGVVVLDRSLRVEFAAGPGLLAFGLEPATLGGRRLRGALSHEVRIILSPALGAAIEGRGARLQIPTAGRDHVLQVAPIPNADDRVAGVVVSFYDVTHPSSRQRRLSELASRDSLTGLWNRRRLEHELDRLLSAQNSRAGVVLLVDLDEFKQVNDRLGHEAGDELLCRVARALESGVRRTDLVARLGGDEFALLLPNMTQDEAGRVAEKVASTVRSVWPPGLPGGASVGCAVAGGRHLTPTAVLAAADRAMYASKRSRCLAQAS
jgi:diguanylate cyclase (GGDEF)-like protein